jgi:maltoporin
VVGLSGLLVTSVAARAVAQDVGEDVAPDTQTDPRHNTEQPKEAEHPAPIHEATGQSEPTAVQPVAPPPPTTLPVARPKVGDLSITGYFRGGFGGIVQESAPATASFPAAKVGGRMTCFSLTNPAGLVAKYRLGNECEVWSETHFTIVTYAGDDGVVSTVHFMPTIFIPTSNIGYSPNGTVTSPAIFTTATGATISFPNLYVDLKGLAADATVWAGTRYYKRESVYINDFFYWNPSGVGAGIEDIHIDKDLRLSYGVFAVDGQPQTSANGTDPLLPDKVDFGVRQDLQLRGIKPWESGELQIGAQLILDYSHHLIVDSSGNPILDANGNEQSVTHSGWGFTVQFVQKVLGGDNKLVGQIGKGGGTGFGTLSRFYYPDFSLYVLPNQYRIRALDVLTIQPYDFIGGQFVVIYQRDQNWSGVDGQYTTWWSAGGRVTYAPFKYFKVAGEIGFDQITKSISPDVQQLTKYTIAPMLTTGRGFMTRPELRLFFTWAKWTDPARGAGVDSGSVYRSTQFLSGANFGLQAETWF